MSTLGFCSIYSFQELLAVFKRQASENQKTQSVSFVLLLSDSIDSTIHMSKCLYFCNVSNNSCSAPLRAEFFVTYGIDKNCGSAVWLRGMWGRLKLSLRVRHSVHFYILSSAIHLLRGWIRITTAQCQECESQDGKVEKSRKKKRHLTGK